MVWLLVMVMVMVRLRLKLWLGEVQRLAGCCRQNPHEDIKSVVSHLPARIVDTETGRTDLIRYISALAPVTCKQCKFVFIYFHSHSSSCFS
ncbi:GL14623 [Drosophila persimilis]|uniref:GL14623 n=1 Tax=Drosophila persimilis TaxID=7234 RepID=B4GVQ7_DROPE|nr:GL14623 [Drosophila persimilis]